MEPSGERTLTNAWAPPSHTTSSPFTLGANDIPLQNTQTLDLPPPYEQHSNYGKPEDGRASGQAQGQEGQGVQIFAVPQDPPPAYETQFILRPNRSGTQH